MKNGTVNQIAGLYFQIRAKYFCLSFQICKTEENDSGSKLLAVWEMGERLAVSGDELSLSVWEEENKEPFLDKVKGLFQREKEEEQTEILSGAFLSPVKTMKFRFFFHPHLKTDRQLSKI